VDETKFPTKKWLHLGNVERYDLGNYYSLMGSRLSRVRLNENY